MEEIWKDIPNYEGLYQASNLGNIRVMIFHNNICKKEKIHILKQQIDKYGRKRVILYKNGKPKLYQVHTLIANTFLNKNNYKKMKYEDKHNIDITKLEINHRDENPLNNCVENLEWCTHNYNMHYGNIKEKQKIGRNANKVIQYDIDFNKIKIWDRVIDITKEMGISKQSISYCCKGKTKMAGGYIWRYFNG